MPIHPATSNVATLVKIDDSASDASLKILKIKQLGTQKSREHS